MVAAELVVAMGSVSIYWCLGNRPLHARILRDKVSENQLRDTVNQLTGSPIPGR